MIPTLPSPVEDFTVSMVNVSPNSTEAVNVINQVPNNASSVAIALDNTTISATKLTGDLGNVGLTPPDGGSHSLSITVRDSTLIQTVLVISGYWVVDGDLTVTLTVSNSTIRSSQLGLEGLFAVTGNAVISIQADDASDLSGSTFLMQGGVLAAGNLQLLVNGQTSASTLANDTSNSAGLTGLMSAGEEATLQWTGYLGGMNPEVTPSLFETSVIGNSSAGGAYAELAVEAEGGKLARAQAGQSLLDALCAGSLSFGSSQFDDVFDIVGTYMCASSSASTAATYDDIYADTEGEATGDLSSDADGVSTSTPTAEEEDALDNSSPLPGNQTTGVEDVINNVSGSGSTSDDEDVAEAPSSADDVAESSPAVESSPSPASSATEDLGSSNDDDEDSGAVQGDTVAGSVVLGRKMMQLVVDGEVASPSAAPSTSPSPASSTSPATASPSPTSPDESISLAGVEVGRLFFSEDFATYLAAMAQTSLTAKDYDSVIEDKALMILQAVDDEAANAFKKALDTADEAA